MERGELINPENKYESVEAIKTHEYKSHLRECRLNKEKDSYVGKVI